MPDLKKLEKKLEFKFKDFDKLKQALVHRSYINEHPDFLLGHNERLEFLGDAVLELIITKYLFNHYPEKPEGILTNWRASLVNSKMLYQVASELKLDNYLYLSKGEAKEGTSKSRQFIMADAVEGIIGAMYLDQGIDKTEVFVNEFIVSKLHHIITNELYLDPKSRLQELAQDKESITPHYDLLKEEGPDHEKTFTIGVYFEDSLIAKGQGSSKHEAEVNAAKKALKIKKW
ncbi:MAG TPA: ribonuclease III [Patescibacteria group bacterium]|nr:ribonuclease III [Patescibacteria group bacterium]